MRIESEGPQVGTTKERAYYVLDEPGVEDKLAALIEVAQRCGARIIEFWGELI